MKCSFNSPTINSLLICLLSLGVALESRAQSPEIVDSRVVADEYGSAGWLSLKVHLSPDYYARVDGSTDFGTWIPVTDSVFSPGNELELYVPMEEAFPGRFFRVVTWPGPVQLDMGDTLKLVVDDASTSGDLAGVLALETGEDVFLPPEGEEGGDVKPGTYEGENVDDLIGQLGMRLWTPAFDKDDPALARLFPEDPRDQVNPLPDDNPGEGIIDDGWQGDEVTTKPIDFPDDPPVDPRVGMPFEEVPPEIKPGTPPEEIPNYRDPGTHLRVILKVYRDGTMEPMYGFQLDGDALQQDMFPVPDVGSSVWVVRTPVGAANEPGQIFYIGTGPDPFVDRSYDPPFRGAHGVEETDEGILRIPVPVPYVREEPVLDGLSLEVYRYLGGADLDFLTADGFERNPKSFQRLAAMDEKALLDLLAETTNGMGQVQAQASSVTQLHYSGPRSQKFNFVIIGDGFKDTTADQNKFNDYVDDVVMDQLFSHDINPEILNAVNVFRINTVSQDSGVTQVNSSGNVTVARNTALMFRYSGVWSRCWMELTPFSLIPLEFGSEIRLQLFLNQFVPDADMVAVVLNETSGGGCARSSHFAVTLGSSWATFAHEFGHNPGTLGDEYQCNQGSAGCGSYSGSKPGAPNLDNTTSRNGVKWKQWIPSWRPVPTALANVADTDQDVGIFPGATIGSGQWWTGIYRPSWRGRMNNNSPEHNPVGYTKIRENFRPRQEGNFRKSVVGDFDGDGLSDLVILDDRQLSLYLARLRDVGPDDPIKGSPPRTAKGVLEPTWYNTDRLPNAAGNWLWITRKHDILRVGDFDNDGKDDLYVANLVDWAQPYLCMLKSFGDRFEPVHIYATSLPGWTMTSGDDFYVADIDGDSREDLLVFNGSNWIYPYFLMARSTGSGLQYVRRYDHYLPGWEMGKQEKFHVGDFNNDGLDDVAVLETATWAQVHLRVYTSKSGGLSLRDRYYGTIQTASGGNFWQMRRKDVLHALDYDGDGTTDLAIFNGFNWGPVYLGMMRVDNGKIIPQKRYDNSKNNVPGWQMRRSDKFWAANVNGDARDDLVVYNAANWSTQYLGMLRSTGSGNLQGTWQDDWIGGWNLGSVDDFYVSDFRGTGGWDDLFVFNKNWFGLLRSHSNHYKLEAIYSKWIHNHRWNAYGLW